MIRARLIVFFLWAVVIGCRQREVARPNVLLITLDTFRADRLGPLTPSLARLASARTSFDNAMSAAPLTLPSHATILSGLLPPHHGLRNNGSGSFPNDRPTLATVFSAAGYRTGAFVSAFVLDHRFGLSRGFDLYDDAIARDPNGNSPYDAERRGGETVDRAVAWLSKGERPFFAWVHLYDAHAPYAPPMPFPQTYDGEIAYVDQQVGRLESALIRFLKGSPVADITIFGGFFGDKTPVKQYNYYGQDDIAFNKNLIVNVGLRYDLWKGFDLDQRTNPIWQALSTQTKYNESYLKAFQGGGGGKLKNDTNNWAPRIGFTYDLTGDSKKLIRGGYGRYFDFPYTNATILFPAAAVQANYSVIYNAHDDNGIKNPDGSLYQIGKPLPPNQLPGADIPPPNEVANPSLATPYSDQLSLGYS